MDEIAFQLLRAAAFVLAALLAWALQRLSPHRRLGASGRVNLPLWGINAALLGVVCGACACTVARWAAAHDVGLLNVVRAPVWVAVLLTIPALDAVSYLWHRANHRVPLLWRFHRVHHSDLSFTASTGVRFHPGELLLSLPLRLGAVVLLGTPAIAVVVFEAIFTVANLVEHGDIDVPHALERRVASVLVTPALHRGHHTNRRVDPDHNFGTIFVLWDRVLGTYRASSSAARIETGLAGQVHPIGLGRALLMPLRGGAAG